MTSVGLKTRMLLTIGVMLSLSMGLQSMVLLLINVRASVREDVGWAKQTLQNLADGYPGRAKVGEEKTERTFDDWWTDQEREKIFFCLQAETPGEDHREAHCRFSEELKTLSQQSKLHSSPLVGFVGAGLHVFLIRSEMAIFTAPIRNKQGQVIGTLSAERSLLPIYSRYEQETLTALLYLIVNLIIFSVLCFFRIEYLVFRPLDRLAQKAENYHTNQQTLLLPGNDESVFHKLSVSLNSLVDRIERDNRKLRQTVDELKAANKELKYKNELVTRSEKLASVGRLSAGLAHEVGNPLSIISGYVELLGREDLKSEEKRQFSEKAKHELDRITRLIRQLLEFAGPMNMVVGGVSVNMVVKEAIGILFLEKTLTERSITTDLHAEHDTIVANKDSIHQILINILFNSIDATAGREEDEREIIVETSNQYSEVLGWVVVVSVKDNGIGIDEKHLQYVFDPFFTTKEVGRGTGLGLYVCHSMVDSLGGKITLRNRASTGVEVKIELPVQEQGFSSLIS